MLMTAHVPSQAAAAAQTSSLQRLQSSTGVVSDFMSNNMLKLNGDATHLMLLATGKAWRTKLGDDSRTLDTGQEIISTSRTEMLLGGLIYQNLKWTEHILLNEDSLIKKLGTRLNALKIIWKYVDFQIRKMFANGLFMSKLIYLIPFGVDVQSFSSGLCKLSRIKLPGLSPS